MADPKQTAHTPTPWRIRQHPAFEDEFHISAAAPEDHPYFGRTPEIEIMSDEDYPRKRADADLIVQAVNSHAALVEALEAIRRELEDIDEDELTHAEKKINKLAEAALKAAKGE